MSSKECEEQLNSLIEHFNNDGLDFNTNDIEAIKHLLLENKMQHDKINCLNKQLQQRDEVIEEAIDAIQNFMTHIDDGFCADMMTFIDILNKYKKEESK